MVCSYLFFLRVFQKKKEKKSQSSGPKKMVCSYLFFFAFFQKEKKSQNSGPKKSKKRDFYLVMISHTK